jgi:hypothetical protein
MGHTNDQSKLQVHKEMNAYTYHDHSTQKTFIDTHIYT